MSDHIGDLGNTKMTIQDIIIAVLIGLVPVAGSALFWTISQIVSLKTDVKWIIISMENMGKNAAKVLHRDDDRFKIDDLLEKYYNRCFELSREDWMILDSKCAVIIEDTTLDRGYRSAAVALKMVCDHKLLRPPKKYKL